MKLRLAAPVARDSIVDGPGLRAVVWAQGCFRRCPGCHNPGTHDPSGGFVTNTERVIERIRSFRLQRGVTLSGGEPFLQPRPLAEVARAARLLGLDVWCFSGYTFERLADRGDPDGADRLALLELVDVLVDGPYIREKRALSLRFRGSSNQRIIDVPRSLASGAVVTVGEYMEKAV